MVPRAHVVLRDRPLLDVADLSLRFFVSRGRPFAALTGIVVVPGFVASVAIAHALGPVWGWIAALVLGALAQTPFVILASKLVFETEPRLRDVLSASLRAAPSVIGLRVVQAVALGVAYTMIFLPGLWASAVFVFSPEILLLERGGLRATLRRAQAVSSVAFTDALFADLLLGAMLLAATLGGEWVGRAVAGDVLQFRLGPGLYEEGISVFALLGLWATLPLRTTTRFFAYLNVRTRSEGWDIQTRFAAIAARAEASRSAP